MSTWNSVFIGPYAEWKISEANKPNPPFYDTELFDTLISDEGPLLWRNWLLDVHSLEIDGTTCYPYHFMPSSKHERCGKPVREMFFWGQGMIDLGILDLTDVDRQVEMNWFAKEFAKELQQLADYFGSPPVFRWGALESLN